MKTWWILFAPALPLFLDSAGRAAFAEPLQGTNSFQVFAPLPQAVVPARDRHSTAGRTGRTPDEGIGTSSDSTHAGVDASPLPTVYYFYEPFPMDPGASLWQVGASVSLLPYPDSEQEVPIPGLDIQYKRGVTENISFVGSFSTSFFSNLLHTGFQVNLNSDKLSVGLANHIGGAYGFIARPNLFDDVKAYALFDMALLRVGYRFDEFSLSCSFVASYVLRSMSYVNNLRASIGPQQSINDYYCTVVVEQPFLRSTRLSMGISLGYARTPYQSWMLYNTIDEWMFVPEFFFAVQL